MESQKVKKKVLNDCVNVQGKIIGTEGWISLGPWEWKGGVYSTYKLDGPIMGITIWYGDVIDSIVFESKSRDGIVIGSSVKIGGTGGGEFIKIYGPFGPGGGNYESIPIEGGVIAGFYGCSDNRGYLEAIGIFVAPKVDRFPDSEKDVDSLNSIQDPHSAPTQLQGKIRGEEGWISYGPWGGNDGVDWAYKANGPIMQISICYGQAINSILFESKSYDGVLIGSSQKIGGTSGHATEMFCIDTSKEQLSSLRLSYTNFSREKKIASLWILTNLNTYGPIGSRSGASYESIPIEGGVFGGLHGRTDGRYITAIGTFAAPKVNNLHSIQDLDSAPIQLKDSYIGEWGLIKFRFDEPKVHS